MALLGGIFSGIVSERSLDMISGGPMYTFGSPSFDSFDFFTQLGRTTWEEVNGFAHPGYEALGMDAPQYWEPLPEADGHIPGPDFYLPTLYAEPSDPNNFIYVPDTPHMPWLKGPVLDLDYHYNIA